MGDFSFTNHVIANTVGTIGDVYATGYITNHKIETKHVRGSLLLDGFDSSFAVIINVFLNTSFSQNVGFIGVTKVASGHVVVVTGINLLILGFLPKVVSTIAVIPNSVIGGTVVLCWGMIMSAGVGMICSTKV